MQILVIELHLSFSVCKSATVPAPTAKGGLPESPMKALKMTSAAKFVASVLPRTKSPYIGKVIMYTKCRPLVSDRRCYCCSKRWFCSVCRERKNGGCASDVEVLWYFQVGWKINRRSHNPASSFSERYTSSAAGKEYQHKKIHRSYSYNVESLLCETPIVRIL